MAVDGLHDIVGVKGRKDQMARFGGCQGDRNALHIAEFFDHKDVRVFPERDA